MKAGKLAYGTDMCIEKIKFNKAKLIIIAEDASDNTKDKFKKLCDEKNIIYIMHSNKTDLSRAIR